MSNLCVTCGGLRPKFSSKYCKECALLARRESDKVYREKNRESRAKHCRQWRKNNPEKSKASGLKYRQENLERRRQSSRDYYRTDIGRFKYYESNAKARGYDFCLTFEQFSLVRDLPCFYCGRLGPNGVDRVDNDIGYVLTNCQPCCKLCNMMKRDLSLHEFRSHIKLVYAHFSSNQ